MKPLWKHKRILLTSGSTREYLDPVRFLGNAATGRMGWALARAARRLGAKVTVVSGPTHLKPPRGVAVLSVVTAEQMRRKVLALSGRSDVVIAAAAVSDWRFSSPAGQKIKKSERALRLTLIPNPDIIKEVGRRRRPGQVIVGFALETRGLLARAREKLLQKGLDLIVANGLPSMGGRRSRAVILTREGRLRRLPEMSKERLAREIFREVEALL